MLLIFEKVKPHHATMSKNFEKILNLNLKHKFKKNLLNYTGTFWCIDFCIVEAWSA